MTTPYLPPAGGRMVVEDCPNGCRIVEPDRNEPPGIVIARHLRLGICATIVIKTTTVHEHVLATGPPLFLAGTPFEWERAD